MVEKLNIELDEPFLKKFFGLTEREIPEDQEITMSMLRRQLDEIETAIDDARKEAKNQKPEYTPPQSPIPPSNSINEDYGNFDKFDNSNMKLPKKNILIIDDLGVITYQLEVLFKQFGFEVTTSKEIYDAIEKFKKQDFDLVVMDLFIPTEREGIILLEELIKISPTKSTPAKIGIMSASSRKEHKQLCKKKGAEFYVEKVDEWQKELFKIVRELK